VKQAMAGDQASIAQLLAGDPAAAINYKTQQDRFKVEDTFRDRTLDQDADQFGQTIGLQRDQFGHTVNQDGIANLLARDQFGLETRLGEGSLEVARMNAETSRMGVNNDAAAQAAEAAAALEINVDDEASFRREYNSITSGFRDVQSSYGRIKATDATTPAGQLSLVYQYMKMLDPGSTVMQGEQASASNAAGVPDRTRNLYNSIINGKPLSAAQVNDFTNQADLLYTRSLQDYDKARTTYEGLANLYGFAPERTVPDLATGRAAPAVGSDGVPNMLRAPETSGPSTDDLVAHYLQPPR